jgi:hypothetical protein
MKDADSLIVELKMIHSQIMSLLIDWIYMEPIRITWYNVESLLIAADRLQMIGLINECSLFLEVNLNYQNVIKIKKFASFYWCKQLKQAANNFIM